MDDKRNLIITELRCQVESLRRIVDELEHNAKLNKQISNETNQDTSRVIHLKNNPFDIELKAKQREFNQLKEENDLLKARLKLLESGNDADITKRIDDVVNDAHKIEQLSKCVEDLKKREEKMLISFRKTSREFREVVYLLTGYRVELLKDGNYRLLSMYAEREEDKLLFEISRDGVIQLLKNDYSDRLSDYITTYLEQADSFPAFLASITLDLFKSSTQLGNMSMSMSTTIVPKPAFTSNKS